MSEEKGKTVGVVDESEKNGASSAHQRINMPLNLSVWKHLAQDQQEALLWFHQHLLDAKMTWTEAEEAAGFDRSTIWRCLKGTYAGSWANIKTSILSYKRLVEERGTIQRNEFVSTPLTNQIHAALSYALASNSITTIIGESRMGKTVSALAWRDANNHGRSVFVTAPPIGGPLMLLRRIAEQVGVARNQSSIQILDGIYRSFNKHRILIVDEAHRLLPGDRRCNPVNLEVLRDIKDSTGCALALLATQRFDAELRKGEYQFEQLLGRISVPLRLKPKLRECHFEPIIRQYVKKPGKKLLEAAGQIANNMGRLGILVETLKLASKMASKAKTSITEEHIFKAISLLRQLAEGENKHE